MQDRRAELDGPDRRSSALVWAWCLYDWAYSAFNTVVTTFVFATYFVQGVAQDAARGTSLWAGGQAVAGLVVALCAAPVGALADGCGVRRKLFTASTLIMVGCTGALWLVRPEPADVPLALALVCAATVAYELATTLYNAMLPELAAPGRLGRVSGLAWSAGYVGGLCCLALCLVVLIQPAEPPFGLVRDGAQNIRAAAVFAALWMLVFSVPLLLLARSPARTAAPGARAAIRQGAKHLAATLRHAKASPSLLRFLVARMLYADGLTTLFAFGAIYAAGRFGMDTAEVLQLGIGLTATAGAGALGFALIEDRIGSRTVVLLCLACLVALGAAVLLAPDRRAFWWAALPLGVFLGPAQSASRSLMAQLAPPGERNAMFGLYALSGRVTGFAGPAALGIVTALAGSQQAGMAVILALLIAGGALLATVQTATPRRLARAST